MRVLLALLLAASPASAADLSIASILSSIKLLPPPAQEPGQEPVSTGKLEIYHIKFESLIDNEDRESVKAAADADPNLKVVVDKEAFELRVMNGPVVLFRTPVAVGSGKTFESGGRKYVFDTPIGKRVVRDKQVDPVWVPPDWNYRERAAEKELEVARLVPGKPVTLADGRVLEIQGGEVGITEGDFWTALPPGDIIFDGTLFIPPYGSSHRKLKGVLGPYKLDMGGGFLIHGVNKGTAGSIGTAASHGCVRVANDQLDEIYALVPIGTPVYIY